MSSLAERIAAKKAAQQQAASIMASVEAPTANAEPVEEPIKEKKEEEAPKAVGKPLSFAEKIALKKAQSAGAEAIIQPATAPIAEEPSKSSATSTEPSLAAMPAPKHEVPDEVVIKIVAAVAEEDEHAIALETASPADAQAYADIKAKLNLLSDMADTELKSAMTDLKKALLNNPQACYLMLPQDIGQMVVALRAMKNEAVVEATKEPKEKKAAKAKASKPLTAEEIAAAFDEL